jgi:hypothetical protein
MDIYFMSMAGSLRTLDMSKEKMKSDKKIFYEIYS